MTCASTAGGKKPARGRGDEDKGRVQPELVKKEEGKGF
jgi:hypothetical protein